MTNYNADAPVSSSEQDRFQRAPFARRVAQIIALRKDPESIVVGINGAWGEGKTTVFNFIEEELSSHSEVVWFRFNPWIFSSETKLIQNFFQSLTTSVNRSLTKKHEEWGTWLTNFVAPAASLGGAGEVVKAVGDFMSTVELDEMRRRVETALEEEKKRVVVLMDDIDRLDKNEVQTVFRLVKLAADFRYTSYILAFDDKMVASALQERYSTSDPDAGRNFLEKIVQVPLDLPKIPLLGLRSYLFEILSSVLDASEIDLNESDVQRFGRGFTEGLELRLNTPRMVKRYANILSFALPLLKGEADTVDIMLIEGIRVFYPKLYDAVRDNPGTFVGNYGWGLRDNRDQIAAGIRKIVEDATEGMTDAEKKAAKEVVKELFPQVGFAFGGYGMGNDWQERWSKEQRIASQAYFQRYFSYAIPSGDVGDRLIVALIASLESETTESIVEKLNELLQQRVAATFISKMRQASDSLSLVGARKLAIAVGQVGTFFPKVKQPFAFLEPRGQAAILINNLIDRVKELAGLDHAARLVTLTLQESKPLHFTIEILRWIRFEGDDDETESEHDSRGKRLAKAFSTEFKANVQAIVEKKLDEAFAGENFAASLDSDSLTFYLRAWSWVGTKAKTEVFVRELLKQDPTYAIKLLDGIRPTAFGSGGAHRMRFDRESYNAVVEICDPEDIIQAVEKSMGPLPTPEESERVEPSQPLALAERFVWMHRRVLEERQQAEASPQLESPEPDSVVQEDHESVGSDEDSDQET